MLKNYKTGLAKPASRYFLDITKIPSIALIFKTPQLVFLGVKGGT